MTAVDARTGEILGAPEARSLVDSIKADVADLGERIATAYLGRAWEPLGYADWDALCEAEFDGARIRIPREQRVEQVQSLRASGLSTRAIGAALGMSEATVRRDLPAATFDAPTAVVGQDGKQYAPTQPPRTKQTETHTTKTETAFDPATGELLPVAHPDVPDDTGLPTNPVQQREPVSRPEPSPEAAAAESKRNSDIAWSQSVSTWAAYFARLALDKHVSDHVAKYRPEVVAPHDQITTSTLRDAAAYLLALADAWEDKAA